MALFTLETLVLSPFATLCGGRTVELCLGTSAEGYPTPEIVISMRHSADPGPVNPRAPEQKPAVADRQADAWVGGAGRSLRAGWSRPVAAASAADKPGHASSVLARSNPEAGLQPVTRTTATSGTAGW